jgi:hypothetical protein
MSAPIEALKEHSRCLLTQIRMGEGEEALLVLLHEREERVQAAAAALARGEGQADDPREIQELEEQILAALLHRREAILRELAALTRARSAHSAYRLSPARGARYLDREG